MTHRARRVFLCATILFFILATPSVLLYAWGYTFDWESKKLVLTGGIYLKSIPKKAKVELDNKITKETPVFIKRLLPKYYQIKVSKQGFHSWQKKLKIESKLVTEVKNILLIPLNPEIEVINENIPINFSLKEFLSQKESNDIFYIQIPSYILYKTDKNNSFQEQISLTPLPQNQTYEIFASKDKRIAVLSNTNQLYLLNPETKIFELISQDVKGVRFSDNNKKMLYFTDSEIWIHFLQDKDSKEMITRISQKIKQAIWYGVTNEHIIFTTDKEMKIIELDNRNEKNTVDILKSNIQEIAYNNEDESIYFIKEKELLKMSLK
ncbi:MAG: PEGA domain-containing protein [bacterium]